MLHTVSFAFRARAYAIHQHDSVKIHSSESHAHHRRIAVTCVFPTPIFCVILCSATQKIPVNSVNLLCCDSARLPNIERKFRRRCDHKFLRRLYEKTIATQGVRYILGRQNFPPAFLLLYRRKQKIFCTGDNSTHASCAARRVIIPSVCATARHRRGGFGCIL